MKYLLILIMIAVSCFTVTGQTKNEAKPYHRHKIKNGNILIVPDQKPVIIERREDSVFEKRKENPVISKTDVPPLHAKKLYGAKSVRPLVKGQSKKTVRALKNNPANKER